MSGTALDVFAIGTVLWLMTFHVPALQTASGLDGNLYTYFFGRATPDLAGLAAELGLSTRISRDPILLGGCLQCPQ
jgi:hypothetical protein